MSNAPTSSPHLGHAAREPLRAGDGGSLPGWKTPGVRWLLVLGVVLLGLSWWRTEGYPLADGVEYMEEARELVRGQSVRDKEQLRSFGFTSLLVPIFAVAEPLGRAREAVWLARALQIALTLALAVMTVRLSARFVSRTSALAAGTLFLVSPTILEWGIAPVSGIAAGLCIALALEQLFDARGTRRHLQGGLWLGAAFLMAFKTLPLIVPIAALCALRAGARGWRSTAALFFGLASCVLFQAVVDVFYYGRFGASIWFWAGENIVINVSRIVHRFDPSLAERLYNNAAGSLSSVDAQVQAAARRDSSAITTSTSKLWYFAHLPAIYWPAAALAVAGLVRAARRMSWATTLWSAALVLDLAALSWKSAKSFRLWLPVLALCGVASALGWDWLFESSSTDPVARGPRRPSRRRALGRLVVAATVLWTTYGLLRQDTTRFAGFWRAADVVNRWAAETRADRAREAGLTDTDAAPRLRFASAFHWAVYLRESADVELVKLPFHLDYWPIYDELKKEADRAALAQLDVLCVHLPLLLNHPEVHALVNELFEVHTVLYDREGFEDTGPLFLLVARSGDPEAATFWDLTTDETVESHRARHGLGDPRYVFKKPRPGSAPVTWQELTLLGFDWRPLPGEDGGQSDFGWITYHWTGGPFDGEDYTFVDRLSSWGPNAWRNDHRPAYGQWPTDRWEAGWILREGFLVVPEERPFALEEPWRPVGDDYRRGDVLPASLWLKVVGYDDSEPPRERTRLVPYPAGSPLAVEELALPGGPATLRGLRVDAGLMARVGTLGIAVGERYRLADTEEALAGEDEGTGLAP